MVHDEVRKKIAVRQGYQAVVDSLWPNVEKQLLWDRKRSRGFATIPKTISLIMRGIDVLTKGKPASNTYFALWVNTFDMMYVEGKDEHMLALESGFEGPRAVSTWRSRMASLKTLGFIDVRGGHYGPYSNILIWDPHLVMRRLKEVGVTEGTAEKFEAIYLELLKKNSMLRGSFAFDKDNDDWKRLPVEVPDFG